MEIQKHVFLRGFNKGCIKKCENIGFATFSEKILHLIIAEEECLSLCRT